MPESVLIIGGAGYIGSHVSKLLARRGHNPVILDDLSTGHRPSAGRFEFHQGSYADPDLVEALLSGRVGGHKFTTVMHFGAKALVEESMRDPLLYYDANVSGTIVLLRAMLKTGVKRFIFSSTCATFGMPTKLPLDETQPQNPINTYGQTKLAVERMLADLDRAHGLRSAVLRYFNAAGADPEGELGEWHNPETHLLPRAIRAALGGQQSDPLRVFGTDYPTPDGTCVRDYVHVNDLGDAHIRAMEKLAREDRSFDVNLGSERGYTVLEVIREIERVSRKPLAWKADPRRAGDPPELVADSSRARKLLDWKPAHDLASIVGTAYRWLEAHPRGYER